MMRARRSPPALGISALRPSITRNAFRKAVIEPFVASLPGGARRRCPASACNQQIKFADLLHHRGRDLGARRALPPAIMSASPRDAFWGRRGLYIARAARAERDQSYFLFGTTFDELDFFALFRSAR